MGTLRSQLVASCRCLPLLTALAALAAGRRQVFRTLKKVSPRGPSCTSGPFASGTMSAHRRRPGTSRPMTNGSSPPITEARFGSGTSRRARHITIWPCHRAAKWPCRPTARRWRWAAIISSKPCFGTWSAANGSASCLATPAGLVFSGDGKWLITAGDTVVRLWDPATGQLVRELRGHGSASFTPWLSRPTARRSRRAEGATSVAPDKIRSAYGPPRAAKRSQALQEEVGDNQRLRSRVYGLAFSADGKTLAAAGGHSLQLWDVERRKPREQLAKCKFDAAFSPAANRLVAGKFGIYDATAASNSRSWRATSRSTPAWLIRTTAP